MSDPTARTILKVIRGLGYAVSVHDDEHWAMTARGNGETHHAKTDDEYTCACRLAEWVGIDLEDG